MASRPGTSDGHPSADTRRYTRQSMLAFPTAAPTPSMGPPPLPVIPCDFCELMALVYHCNNCDANFCNKCWPIQLPHRPGKVGPDGLPHEKADMNVVKRLKQVFDPPSDEESQIRMHIDDEDSTWFGIDRDGTHRPFFQDCGRYATLMADSAGGDQETRYPQLVSFVGQTGAGKSTLIKMLIEKQSYHSGLDSDKSMFPSPIVGSVGIDHIPTSGDVHLYADPRTFLSPLPMLYADCEGLEGGETIPMGARHRESEPAAIGKRHGSVTDFHGQGGCRWRMSRENRREIIWANNPDTQERQFAVTEFYPRLLYTFSDVIVFVLQNARAFETSVLSKLLSWASAAIEGSTNQPVLPHAIIALNSTDLGVFQTQWEIDFATDILLSSDAGGAIYDPKYKKYLDYWTSQGRKIRSMKDLLECYYSSIRVVRIPKKGRYMLLEAQIGKLQEEIISGCEKSFESKRQSRMLSNSEEFQTYLQSAFSHFCRDLNAPFNFMEIAIKNNPIPSDFGGNILKLAKAMRDTVDCVDAFKLFSDLSFMVASCIMLDCARHLRKGPAEELLEKYYFEHCEFALEDFCDLFWPCEYSSRQGKCVNIRKGHTKGHQDGKGKLIGSGKYVSKFSWDSFHEKWFQLLLDNIVCMQDLIASKLSQFPQLAERHLVAQQHRANIEKFYQDMGDAKGFFSHSTCFCCLREMMPEHALFCGHVICEPCLYAYGSPKQMHVLELDRCPLHEQKDTFPRPWTRNLKPALAGVRILSLDGGGIRGIVELEVLYAIENYLGGKIRIQKFFDLIVGTSTGGIIAMGLGVEQWSVATCIDHFLRLTDKAFTPRLPGLARLGRRYRTQPFEESLQKTFHDEYLFGGEHEQPSNIKVAITATSDTGANPMIMTNYNRQLETLPSYKFVRPDDVTSELRLWGVSKSLRATCAAPGYFKPFVNSRTKEGYLDGALYYNNPAKVAHHESKLLWPDVQEYHPDILLSIGTGHCGEETNGTHEGDPRYRNRSSDIVVIPYPRERKFRLAEWFRGNELLHTANAIVNRMGNNLNSEQMWSDFKRNALSWRDYAKHERRYRRVNLKLGDQVPKLDDKGQMQDLQRLVKSKLAHNQDYRKTIAKVAHRLVASSFYFERLKEPKLQGGRYYCHGEIRCRFPDGSASLRDLGSFLQTHQQNLDNHIFQPYFSIEQDRDPRHVMERVIDKAVIESMIISSRFDMGKFEVAVSEKHGDITISLALLGISQRQELIPISGFPRNMIQYALPSALVPEMHRGSLDIGTQRRRIRSDLAQRQKEENSSTEEDLKQQADNSTLPPRLTVPSRWKPNDWIHRRDLARSATSPPPALLGLSTSGFKPSTLVTGLLDFISPRYEFPIHLDGIAPIFIRADLPAHKAEQPSVEPKNVPDASEQEFADLAARQDKDLDTMSEGLRISRRWTAYEIVDHKLDIVF